MMSPGLIPFTLIPLNLPNLNSSVIKVYQLAAKIIHLTEPFFLRQEHSFGMRNFRRSFLKAD